MFLCVKCILVNKIAANLKRSVYNVLLIMPYQLFCVKNVHLLTLRGGVRSSEPTACLTVAWEVGCERSAPFLLLELQAGRVAHLCFAPVRGKEAQGPPLIWRGRLGFSVRQPALYFSSVTKSYGVKGTQICPSNGPVYTCATGCSRGLVMRNAFRMERIYPGHKRRLAKKTKMSFKINCTSQTN